MVNMAAYVGLAVLYTGKSGVLPFFIIIEDLIQYRTSTVFLCFLLTNEDSLYFKVEGQKWRGGGIIQSNNSIVEASNMMIVILNNICPAWWWDPLF